jgi:hypothetical protein
VPPFESVTKISSRIAHFSVAHCQFCITVILINRILFKEIRTSVAVMCEPGSSVSIVTDYGLDDRGSIPDRGRGFFL